jgi:uncharacterized spore protein YtfJ
MTTNGEAAVPSKLLDRIAEARDAVTVRRVFGEPYEQGGLSVIPAASVRGAAGGGGGTGPDATAGSGEGMGFAVTARPIGAYVVRDGQVSWRPAMDLTRVVLVAEALVGVALLVAALRSRRPG